MDPVRGEAAERESTAADAEADAVDAHYTALGAAYGLTPEQSQMLHMYL